MFSMKSIKKRILGVSNSEKGFTLIEIIAVLVILGILAAIAVPRYLGVQEGARQLSAEAGINELTARATMAYGHLVLESAVNQDYDIADIGLDDVSTNMGTLTSTNGDDYEGSMAANGLMTITDVQGETLTTAVTKQWALPSF